MLFMRGLSTVPTSITWITGHGESGLNDGFDDDDDDDDQKSARDEDELKQRVIERRSGIQQNVIDQATDQ